MSIKLNSTGSFWMSDDGNYWSYGTKMTDYYKGETFKNITFYSVTTAKHQSKIPYVDFNHKLEVGRYGDWNIEEAINRNIEALKLENAKRIHKYKTQNNLASIKLNVLKIKYLRDLLKA